MSCKHPSCPGRTEFGDDCIGNTCPFVAACPWLHEFLLEKAQTYARFWNIEDDIDLLWIRAWKAFQSWNGKTKLSSWIWINFDWAAKDIKRQNALQIHTEQRYMKGHSNRYESNIEVHFMRLEKMGRMWEKIFAFRQKHKNPLLFDLMIYMLITELTSFEVAQCIVSNNPPLDYASFQKMCPWDVASWSMIHAYFHPNYTRANVNQLASTLRQKLSRFLRALRRQYIHFLSE